MRCDEFRPLLRHLDHELPPDLRDEILGDLAEVAVETTEVATPLDHLDHLDHLDRPDRLDRRGRWPLVWRSLKREFTEPVRLLRTAALVAAVLAVALWFNDRPEPELPFTRVAPIVRIAPDAQQTASDIYENPPTGSLSLQGRLI